MTLPSGHAATLMHQLATAPSLDSIVRLLQSWFPRVLLDGTRVDLLISDHKGSRLIFSTAGTFVPKYQSIEQIDYYLESRHFRSILDIPLAGPDMHVGWLVLAHPYEEFDQDTVNIAYQIGALLALRIDHERTRQELMARSEEVEALRQRIRTTDEMRLRATLSAGAAHDIGNLFASVMGHTQLIQQSAPEELIADLRTVEQAARDGHHLLRRVLSSNIQVGDSAMMARTSVNQMISDAIHLTQPFWIDRPDITILSDASALPPIAMHPVDVREILVNLIMNAIAVMRDGGILAIRALHRGNQVAIYVSDTGPGIDPTQQSQMFQPFQTSRANGIGLGLSTAQAIVEAYGGSIEVASTVGRGTTFTILLPCA